MFISKILIFYREMNFSMECTILWKFWTKRRFALNIRIFMTCWMVDYFTWYCELEGSFRVAFHPLCICWLVRWPANWILSFTFMYILMSLGGSTECLEEPTGQSARRFPSFYVIHALATYVLHQFTLYDCVWLSCSYPWL